MKKSAILAIPLLVLTLLVAFTPSTQAAVVGVTKQAASSLMHLCTRFCGSHRHHHGHEWCGGYQHYWCPGHR